MEYQNEDVINTNYRWNASLFTGKVVQTIHFGCLVHYPHLDVLWQHETSILDAGHTWLCLNNGFVIHGTS